jgi:hypothetical protein
MLQYTIPMHATTAVCALQLPVRQQCVLRSDQQCGSSSQCLCFAAVMAIIPKSYVSVRPAC